eukprot:CAMPEP_0197038238 /NCGR_PEP_ID=MMETSP1384-20130603/15202_1 /TAXON_ID=29189 /ORGANISM="Ammonia sp." /LENGTH=287 /DNA_ID=CAMNT_0042468637 /DNA_START=19 /DNA_END=882 /DNA_ORIENTATION=+
MAVVGAIRTLSIWLLATRIHGQTLKNKIVGTYTHTDASGAEDLTLYICRAQQQQFSWSVIKTAALFGNHLIGTGAFTKSDIDGNNARITNSQCFFQQNGVASECSPASFDAANIDSTNGEEIELSFTFDSQAVVYTFEKKSSSIIDNDKLNGYQCGAPWPGNLDTIDVYPLAFVTEPFVWSLDGERDVEVYLDDTAGCWGYVKANGESGPYYGGIANREIKWNRALYLHEWTDDGVASTDPCAKGSQISIRVDKDVLLIGFQCSDGSTGDSLLLYKTSEFDSCPVVN